MTTLPRGLRTLALVLVASSGPGAAGPTEPLFTRAELLRGTTGQIELRRAYTRQLELPSLVCAGSRFSCDAEAIYGQVYELTFTEERIARQPDGSHSNDHVERGRLLVAVDLVPKDEDTLEDALRAEIRALSAPSFIRPQAGMGFRSEALSDSFLARSARPAWTCREAAGTFVAQLVVQDDRTQSTYGLDGEDAARGCGAIARALEDVAPEVLRTRPDVESEERTEVRLRSASTLTGRTWSDPVAQLPAGATLDKRALHGEKTGGMWDSLQGKEAFRGKEGRDGETERKVLIPPASLALVEMPMWVSEWHFATTRESFGKEPFVERDPPVSVILAVAPILDPLMDELARTRTPLAVPEKALVESVVSRFESSVELDPKLVESAFADRVSGIWPGQGDWLVVSCHDDGTAHYGIAPFGAAARVTNALETCAAIRRLLE